MAEDKVAKAIEESNAILRTISKSIERNEKLSAAMLDAMATGDTESARALLYELSRGRAATGDIELDTNEQERMIARGRPQLGGRGFLQRLTTPQYFRPEREIDYIGYRRALGLGSARGVGGFAERFGTMGYSLGAQIQQATVPYRPAGGEFATAEGERMIYSGGKETLGMLSDEERGALLDPQNVDALEKAGLIGKSEANKVRRSLADRKRKLGRDKGTALSPEEYEDLPTVKRFQESILGQLGSRGADITKLGEAEGVLGKAAQKLGGQTGLMGGKAAALFDIGGGMMAGARAIAGPVGIALTAAQMAYEGVDKLYGMNRAGAALGYGFSRNPLDFLQSGTGANVALGRDIQTRLDALTSFGLSGQQTAAARAAVEGMGLGGRGNERSYDSYYRSMTSVMENTGLESQTLAPFYEQFMRAGGANKDLEDLTKLLRDELPKAANQSRMSLSQMAQTLQDATRIAMQSPYNVRTPFEVQKEVAAAFEAGAPKGMENIAAGGNLFIAAAAAKSRGVSIFQAMQNPEAMNIAAIDIMKNTFGEMRDPQTGRKMSFDEYRKTDAGAMKVMQVSAMTGMDVSTMSQIYSEGINDLEVAQGIAEKFGPGGLETMTGERRGKFDYDPETNTWRRYDKTRDTRSQLIKGTKIDIYRSKGRDIQKYYEEQGVMNTIQDALGAKGEEGKKEWEEFQKRLADASGKQGDVAYKYIKEEAMKVAGDITKPGSGDGEIGLTEEARRFFQLNFKPKRKETGSANENYETIHIGGRYGAPISGR